MGKDQSGGFHPPKGKPSGVNKSEGLGISTTPPEEIDQYLERTDEYVQDDTTLDPSLPVRHPNRNVSKNEGAFKGKANIDASDTTIEMSVADEVQTTPEELPPIPDKDLFNELADYRSECCATLYIPTHQAGVEVNEKQDAILFKNALRDLTEKLRERGIEEHHIEQMLTPGYELLLDKMFWTRLGKGLAVFISDGYFKYMKMSVEPNYAIYEGKRFQMTPLIPCMACKEYFYLLVLSKQKCKLFRADAFGMKYVEVEGLPEDVMSVKRLSDKDASTVRIGTSTTSGANFHGMAGGNPEEKDNIAVYFEAVDDVLFKEVFNKENAPLLLAGVEYLIPIYRSACDYHNVCKESLTGSHEHDEIHALYAKAREIMEPLFAQPLDKALTMFANQSATQLTSSIAADVIPAAFYGQLSHIFVKKDEHVWGQFDETICKCMMSGSRTPRICSIWRLSKHFGMAEKFSFWMSRKCPLPQRWLRCSGIVENDR
jgi:hypothetical protein